MRGFLLLLLLLLCVCVVDFFFGILWFGDVVGCREGCLLSVIVEWPDAMLEVERSEVLARYAVVMFVI